MKKFDNSEYFPEGFTFGDREKLQEKIARFIGATASDIHFIFDFDRTLTVRNLDMKDDITTWHVLKEHLPIEGQDRYQELFVKYRAMEIDDTMTQEHAAEWWSSILNLFVEYRLDLNAVEQDLLQRATVRFGTAELFQLCKDHDIPTVIMSAGIREVIEMWDKVHHLRPSLIISTALIQDEENKIIGWKQDTLVHALNKAETDHAELTEIRAKRPKAIVVGDSMNDVSMASGDEDVLRIRIYDPRPDEVVDIESVRNKTFPAFDAMIESGDMMPLVELVDAIVSDRS